jgi:hypothetical protein
MESKSGTFIYHVTAYLVATRADYLLLAAIAEVLFLSQILPSNDAVSACDIPKR